MLVTLFVLILVLVEDGLREEMDGCGRTYILCVLILVLVEDGLRDIVIGVIAASGVS